MAKDEGRSNVTTRNGGIDRVADDLARQVAGLARTQCKRSMISDFASS